jgi:hypothetical protein
MKEITPMVIKNINEEKNVLVSCNVYLLIIKRIKSALENSIILIIIAETNNGFECLIILLNM